MLAVNVLYCQFSRIVFLWLCCLFGCQFAVKRHLFKRISIIFLIWFYGEGIMVGRCRCNAFTTLSPPSSFIGWNSNAILMGCVFFMMFCMCGRVVSSDDIVV